MQHTLLEYLNKRIKRQNNKTKTNKTKEHVKTQAVGCKEQKIVSVLAELIPHKPCFELGFK